MTIASATSRIAYTGDGLTTAFSVPFFFSANADLVVSVQDLAGTVTTKLLGTDYNLTGATLAAGGTCTFVVAPATGFILAVTRVPPITQTASYNNNDPFPAKSHENALDKTATIDQYLKSLIDRAILVAPTDSPPMATLPAAAVRALKNLSFDSLGNPTASVPATGAAVSSAMIPVVTAATLALARTALGIPLTPSLNVADFGAVGDAVGYKPNVTITSGQAAASFSSGTFVAGDVGKAIDIAGAGVAGAPLLTTILSVQSTVAITLSATASTSLSAVAQVVSYGTDNTTALQSAINSARTSVGELYIPNGQYKTTAPLTVTSRLKIRGAGAQGTTTQFYLGGGAQNIISWTGSATIIARPNSSGIAVATDDAVLFDSFGVAYPIQPTALSGITGISLTGGTSNANSVFRDLMIAGPDRGFYVTKAVHWTVHSVQFYNHVSFGIFIDQPVANVGDWDISHNVFLSGSATACTHININAGGGGRIIGNKLDTAGSINVTKGILVNPNGASQSVEPLVIIGNSIEGNNIAIHFTNPGAGSTATQGVITGNQIWAANNATQGTKGCCIQVDSGSGWMSGYVISGNYLNTDGGSGCFGVNIANGSASNVSVTGNTFNNNGLAGVACNFGTGLTNVVHSGNMAVSGTTLATSPAPAVPASTVGLVNTFFTTCIVDIFNGTGTAIFVNGTGVLSQSAGTFRDHIILNPGDTISVTYTVLPNWTWRSFSA